ncbi:hypothetical protein MMC26_000576 [Xylographa opegraphella]|nr:hypothetical protein [Xylographa opegraphella]
MDPAQTDPAAPAPVITPLLANPVDRRVPILVRVQYLRLYYPFNSDIWDMIMVDPHDVTLESLHARLKHLFLTDSAFIMEHDHAPLSPMEQELNETGIDCRVMGTRINVNMRVHRENVKPIVMALAANLEHFFLSVCFGPCG